LQTGGEVGRFAYRRVFLRHAFTYQVTDHDHTRGDTDACLQ